MTKEELKNIVLVAIPYGIGKLMLRDYMRNSIADSVVASIVANSKLLTSPAQIGDVLEWSFNGEKITGVVIDHDLYLGDPMCMAHRNKNDGKRYCPSDYRIIKQKSVGVDMEANCITLDSMKE